jgi:oleandomycin transport system ATP-binding protein
MWEVVRRLVTDGSTVLLTTQYLDEADALADEISVFDHGKVIAHDTPDGLKRTHRRPTDQGQADRPHPARRCAADPRRDLRLGQPRDGPRPAHGLAVDDEGALAATVGRLAAEGIAVTELSLHLPTLDEVPRRR